MDMWTSRRTQRQLGGTITREPVRRIQHSFPPVTWCALPLPGTRLTYLTQAYGRGFRWRWISSVETLLAEFESAEPTAGKTEICAAWIDRGDQERGKWRSSNPICDSDTGVA